MDKIQHVHSLLSACSFGLYWGTFSISLNGSQKRVIPSRDVILVQNQVISTSSVLELVQHFLVYSMSSVASKVAEAVTAQDKPVSINYVELLREQNLNGAIVFANASIEYLQILLMISYSSFDDLNELAKKEKVQKKILVDEIDKSDWDIALYSELQKQFKKWWTQNQDKLPDEVVTAYTALQTLNKDLKLKYQANPLKHYGISTFTKTDKSNVIRQNFSKVDMEQFYLNNITEIHHGSRKSVMNLDEAADFVTNYSSRSVKLFNKVVGSIDYNQS